MAEHEHGSMDITTQQRTFDGFVKFTIRSVFVIIGVLVFMALANA
jgi:hypothetical protein